MGKLTWNAADLVRLLEDAEASWPAGRRASWGQDDNPPAGFWLVGDNGVYLMHNGVKPDGEKPLVVYANECNPDTQPFDEWWANKNDTFGGDDGVDYFEAAQIRECVRLGGTFIIEFTRDQLTMTVEVPH